MVLVSDELADAFSRAGLISLGELLALKASVAAVDGEMNAAIGNNDDSAAVVAGAFLDDQNALSEAAKRVSELEAENEKLQRELAHMRGEALDEIDDEEELVRFVLQEDCFCFACISKHELT